MRALPTIAIILVLLLGGSWATSQYIQSTTQMLEVQLETVEQAISTQQWVEANQELNVSQESWDKSKTWLTMLLDHQEIDTIDLSLKRLEKYLMTQNVALALGEVSTLKLLVTHIFDTEKFTFQNIF